MADNLDQDIQKIMPLIEELLNQGGWDIVEDALDSKDPAAGIGAFFAQLIMQVSEQLAQAGEDLDLRVFLMPGGVIEILLDMAESAFKMPPEFSEEIFKEVVSVIKSAIQEPPQGQQAPQGQPQPQQPQGGGLQAMPQQMGGM